MKILGIDYGSKRIGIASADTESGIAFPRTVLLNDKKLFDNLEKIIKEEEIVKIVLGDSKDYKMKDNPIMEEILKFKKDSEEKFDIKIILYPEVLSSHQAAKMAGGKNDMIDASAAAIILQSYIEREKRV